MKLYAIYKDGMLYKTSYDQNTPFYETIKGAEAAIKSQTNRRSLPYDMITHKEKYTEKDIQDYLMEQKKRYTIVEFSVRENGVVGCEKE